MPGVFYAAETQRSMGVWYCYWSYHFVLEVTVSCICVERNYRLHNIELPQIIECQSRNQSRSDTRSRRSSHWCNTRHFSRNRIRRHHYRFLHL